MGSRILGAAVVLCLVSGALGHGKEPNVPHLSPAVMEALKSTPPPAIVSPGGARLRTCLPGYELRDNECVKPVEEPARRVCDGAVTPEGLCEIEVDSLLMCPGGYKLENGVCTRIVETGFQFYCPKGYYDDGTFCAKSIAGEIATQCPIGELEGDRCVLRERREHLIKAACPEGTVLEDGSCWKELETFDCTLEQENPVAVVTAPKEHMPLGKKVLVSKGKTHSLRALWGKEPAAVLPPPPPQPPKLITSGKEMIAVSAPHPERVHVVSQVCSKKIQVDALALIICPPEYVDSGDYCVKEIYTTPLTICVGGQQKDGTCQPSVKRIPKHPGCPKNSWQARGKCWKKEEREPEKTCPVHFNLINNKCAGVVDAVMECPVGLELVGTLCIGELVRPPLALHVEAPQGHGGKKY